MFIKKERNNFRLLCPRQILRTKNERNFYTMDISHLLVTGFFPSFFHCAVIVAFIQDIVPGSTSPECPMPSAYRVYCTQFVYYLDVHSNEISTVNFCCVHFVSTVICSFASALAIREAPMKCCIVVIAAKCWICVNDFSSSFASMDIVHFFNIKLFWWLVSMSCVCCLYIILILPSRNEAH